MGDQTVRTVRAPGRAGRAGRQKSHSSVLIQALTQKSKDYLTQSQKTKTPRHTHDTRYTIHDTRHTALKRNTGTGTAAASESQT